MNMLPSTNQNQNQNQKRSKHHLIYGYNNCNNEEDGEVLSYYIGGVLLSSSCYYNPLMAAEDDLSRTETSTSKNNIDHQDNKDIDDQGWLQLSIGSSGGGPGASTGTDNNNDDGRNNIVKDDEEDDERSSTRLIELDLLPRSTSTSNFHHVPSPTPIPTLTRPYVLPTQPPYPYNFFNTSSSSMFYQQNIHPGVGFMSGFAQQQQDVMNTSSSSSWGFGTWPRNAFISSSSNNTNTTTTPLASSSSPSTSGTPFFIPRRPPFQVSGSSSTAAAGNIDLRVIDPPPRRLHSGIWFMLQAAQNQAKEPFLPQISKNFLRIKDRRITVRLVQKYLVNKLKLESESEIEIRCRGQQVEPLWTLEHIRDNIWRRSGNLTLLPNSSTLDHIMVLHYARTP